jgi:hypothetical protein
MTRHSLVFVTLLFVFLLSGNHLNSAVFADPPTSDTPLIPSPREVLGFTPGDDRTIADWTQISNYFSRLDNASDRVAVQSLGRTTLGRSLFVAYISAPDNIRQLEKYKGIQRKLADPRLVKGDAERDVLLASGKTVVAISCSIHSTEIVASQMSMQLAYELASAQDADTREILQRTIVILIPSPNPDGVDIVAAWYRKTLGTPYEGKEPPELYHFYAGHDDNRDWFMLNLRETQLITRLFWKEWFPEIVYDVHQQGSNGSRFFIPPFYDPPNPRIAPILLRQVGLLGHKMAADLQARDYKGVITNALYDSWWHGGFRTAPYFHNSIGILSEAASAKLMTPVEVKPEQLAKSFTRGMPSALQPATNFPDPWPGGQWRPRDIMNMELVASRALLSMAAKFRTDYLREFYELGRKNSSPQTNDPVAYLIPAGQGNDENIAKMVDTLISQGVEVHRLDRELHVRFEGEKDFIEAPASSYAVFLAQPYRTNVQSLFEKQLYPDRRGENGEAERPYDVVGWTLPMQMGLETRAVTEIKEPIADRRLTLIGNASVVREDLGLAPAGKTESDRPAATSLPNPIKRPVRIGLYKSWMGNTDEGWTRFVFDTFNVPYSSISDRDVRNGRLREKFDVIILPSMRLKDIVDGNAPGTYPVEFTGGIGDQGVDKLRQFTEDGGTLICFDASSELPIKRFGLPVRNVLEGVKSSEFYCPGSILRITADPDNAISLNMPREIDGYFINSSAFEVMDPTRVKVVARYAKENVLRSGWLLGEKRIAGRVALADAPLGKGHVIMFAFRPQHRGQTWGTFPLIWNAIMSAFQK